MKDKEKLKKLVQIIGDLLKEEGNEWLIDEILQTIGEVSPVEEIAKHSLIQNIHEYCVEQKIDKQAKEFYHSFPLVEIKDQLILDYSKMEHERRRDDFENFCLCMYQQIENISNFLFDKKIESVWNSEKNQIAVKSFFDRTQRKYVLPSTGGTSLEQLVFQGTDTSKWYANRKFRAVLYFFYFKKNVTRDDYEFNSIYFTHEEIYQMRNQNHRGSTPTPYQQKTLNKIKGNESRYFFKFYGFLQDFVNQIESSYSITSNSGNKNKKSSKSKTQKNTIGANNPELEKLKQQMKKNE
ncbi:MAG: hypothetical protein R3277_05370 [Brumimicrobium sp.]|nr:hypothetical protein [Brumimicrobium sp.]